MFSDVGIWHLATTGSGVSRSLFVSLEDVRCFPFLSSSSCLLEVVAKVLLFFKVWHIGWKTFWKCPGHISPLPFFPHVHFDIRVARAPIWITCSFEKNKIASFSLAMRRALREIGFAIRAVQHEKLRVCAARFRLITKKRPTWRQGFLRFRQALTTNYELMLVRVCDEVSCVFVCIDGLLP